MRDPLQDAMARADLSDDEQDAIAGGNCLRLLRVVESRAAPVAVRA
jgi:hypothetical protein